LTKVYSGPALNILADQGSADGFLTQNQLLPEALTEAALSNANVSVTSRMQNGYDHSYFFIASFVKEHLRFHAKHL